MSKSIIMSFKGEASATDEAVFSTGDAALSVIAALFSPVPELPPHVDPAHVLRFSCGCVGDLISGGQLTSFRRVFGSSGKAVTNAWRLLFNPDTGALHPWYWASANSDALRAAVLKARSVQSGPFAVRLSQTEAGFALVHIRTRGGDDVQNALITTDDDFKHVFCPKLPGLRATSLSELLSSMHAANVVTPLCSPVSQHSAGAIALAPHWSIQSGALRLSLARLASELAPARLGSAVLQGSGYFGLSADAAVAAVSSLADSAVPAASSYSGATMLRRRACQELSPPMHASVSPVAAAVMHAGAACVAAVLGDAYVQAVSLVCAARCLHDEYAARACGGPGTHWHLYATPVSLMNDAITFGLQASSLAYTMDMHSEAFDASCAAAEVLSLLYAQRGDWTAALATAQHWEKVILSAGRVAHENQLGSARASVARASLELTRGHREASTDLATNPKAEAFPPAV